jgi:hypothetical protein
MPWPFQSPDDHDTKRDSSASKTTGWAPNSVSQFAQPSVLVPTLILTVTTLGAVRLYKSYLRRIPSTEHMKPDVFRRRSIFGRVTSVGDGDNFRIYHTPGGWLGGWGWLPGRRVPKKASELKGQTV